jgi:hypothetical protein
MDGFTLFMAILISGHGLKLMALIIDDKKRRNLWKRK